MTMWVLKRQGRPFLRVCPGSGVQQNAGQSAPRKDMLGEVAEDIRSIFDAPDRKTAEV
jgi:hypothetical protein